MSDYPGKFGEVCKHKSLMRSCEICDLESRLAEKQEEIAQMKIDSGNVRAGVKALEVKLAEKEKVIERYRKALMEIALDRTENLGNPTWASRTATSALQEGEGGNK